MIFIILFVFRFLLRIRIYGDESHFIVLGSYRIGIAGQLMAVVLGIVYLINEIPLLMPVILSLACLILIFLNIAPMLRVNGEDLECVWLGGKSRFTRSMAEITSEKHGLEFRVGDQKFLIRRDSINYNRLVDWL